MTRPPLTHWLPIEDFRSFYRHIRVCYEDHPGATLPDAIRAWKEKKARRMRRA